MPNFDLSTILGASVTALTLAQAAFPQQQWIGMLLAGVTAIVMKETPKAPEPPKVP
jgi:hypothetical protein